MLMFFRRCLGSSAEARAKIYTKTGDGGTSSLFTGKRVPKNHLVFSALGDTDELNASIGIARELCRSENNRIDHHLGSVQVALFEIGSCVATPPSSALTAHLNRVSFDESRVADLENLIDEMDATLPPLRNFILPSGGKASAALHFSRAVCRRAERSIIHLKESERDKEGDDYPPPSLMKYMNSRAQQRTRGILCPQRKEKQIRRK